MRVVRVSGSDKEIELTKEEEGIVVITNGTISAADVAKITLHRMRAGERVATRVLNRAPTPKPETPPKVARTRGSGFTART